MRKAPEACGEPDPVEDRLVAVRGMRPPVRGEAIVPPGMRQFAQLPHGDRRAGLAPAKPAAYVLFRPEEIHRASSKSARSSSFILRFGSPQYMPAARWASNLVRHTRLQQVAPGPACVPGGHIITSYSARRGRSGA